MAQRAERLGTRVDVFEFNKRRTALGAAHGVRSFGSLAPPKRVGKLCLDRACAERQTKPASPILNHQIELVDEAIDFFEIFTTPLFWFDIERATKSDHVAQVTDGVL